MKKTVMKKLVKFSAIAALFLCSSLAVNAQVKVGINGGVQLPMGDFKDLSKTGFGGGLKGEYMLNPNMGVGLNLGYYAFDGKDLGLYKIKTTMIPVTANYTYYFGEGSFKPYAGIDLGVYILKGKYEASSSIADATANAMSDMVDMFSNIGAGFSTGLKDATITTTTDVSSADESTTSTKIGFAPQVGFQYGFNESLALDMNVKYNVILDGTIKSSDPTKKAMASTVGINLGLVYSFGGK